MSKFYKQLKELPQSSTGSIWEYNPQYFGKYQLFNGRRVFLDVPVVEGNPTWFIEVYPEFKTALEGGVPTEEPEIEESSNHNVVELSYDERNMETPYNV